MFNDQIKYYLKDYIFEEKFNSYYYHNIIIYTHKTNKNRIAIIEYDSSHILMCSQVALFAEIKEGYTWKDIVCYNSSFESNFIDNDKFILNDKDNPSKIEIRRFEMYIFYYINDKIHRENGPAKIYIGKNFKEIKYYNNNLIHRKDGPAIIYHDFKNEKLTKSYYINGKRQQGLFKTIENFDGETIQKQFIRGRNSFLQSDFKIISSCLDDYENLLILTEAPEANIRKYIRVANYMFDNKLLNDNERCKIIDILESTLIMRKLEKK